MDINERTKMFKDVFAPKSGEKVLFLIDTPHGDIKDTSMWKDRREMAQEWYQTFKEIGGKERFIVDWLEFKATGVHNSPLPLEVIDAARNSNLVIAMTEYSASFSLKPICEAKDTNTRCASMPGVERRMEKTSLRADYVKVKKYATTIEKMLNNAIGAEISFSTGDNLYIDLRNRVAESDTGDCSKPGQGINFPSGEGYQAPYEGVGDEVKEFGESKTEGIMPVSYDKELIKFEIKKNKIIRIIGEGKKADELRKFFEENETRRNIAELGIGCNPKAVVTGNVLEDEKVGGLHIAYGMSTHIGGKIKSDTHIDICYPKGRPVEAKTLKLINKNGTKIELISNTILRYELLN